MATQRRSPSDVETVDPNVEEPTEGITKLSEVFGQPMVVDEVQQVQQAPTTLGDQGWVIRTNVDVEDMTVGAPENHFSFKAGTRYRAPLRVAEILYNRDMLMEQPYPYEPQRR